LQFPPAKQFGHDGIGAVAPSGEVVIMPRSSEGTATEPAATDGQQWRLRYVVGELVHYTEWTSDFATVENYYDQYRRGDHGHNVVIERRTEVRG